MMLFNFNLKGEKGLKEILHGKGAMLSYLLIFAFSIYFVIFFFVEPFNIELDSLLIRLFLLSLLLYLSYSFIKTAIEIVVEEDNVQFRTFKKYRKFPFERIRLIKVYYFTTWGTSTISIKGKGKSTRYYLWVPRHERERHELFLQFVEALKEKSEGRFKVKYIT